jgi:hypothetical protein
METQMQNEQLLFYPSGDRHNIFRNRVEQTQPLSSKYTYFQPLADCEL